MEETMQATDTLALTEIDPNRTQDAPDDNDANIDIDSPDETAPPEQNEENDVKDNGTDAKRQRGRPRSQKSQESELKETKLKKQTMKLQQDNKALKKQNETYLQKLSSTTTKCNRLEIENSNLKTELSDCTKQIDDHKRAWRESEGKLTAELEHTNQLLIDSELELSRVKLTLKDNTNQNNAMIRESENVKSALKKQLEKSKIENEKLQKNYNDIKSEFSVQQKVIESSDSELTRLQQLLSQLELERNDLLEQLDVSNNSLDTEVAGGSRRPVGLAICDLVTETVANKLSRNVDWHLVVTNMNNLQKIDETLLEKADIILFLIGAEDIRKGLKGIEIFSTMKPVLLRAAELSKVYVAEIPPTTKPGASGHVSIINYKLSKVEGITVINTARRDSLKDELLDASDNLTNATVQAMADLINIKIILPTTLKTLNSSKEECSHEPYRLSQLVKLKANQIGLVIGQKGATISGLCKKHSVAMRIGKWGEAARGKKDELSDMTDGLLIEGVSYNVKNAAEAVSSILTSKNDN